MTRYQALTIYAALIIATGFVLILLAYYPVRAIQYIVAACMLLSAGFAFLTAYKSENMQIQLNYHYLHGIGMLTYGLAILFWAYTIENFFGITIFFLLYYAMAEMIFCFQLLMMRQKYIDDKIIIYRLLIGFFIALGAVFVLATAYSDQNKALLAVGAVFVFSGVYLILFKTVLKRADQPVVIEQ